MPTKIFPSIMAANQKELDVELQNLTSTAKHLHLDIVDGKFAPSHSLDFKFKLSPKFKYQAHLMVKNPELWIKRHWQKIELFIPQIEELKDFERYTHWMKHTGRKVAVAIKPETTINKIKFKLKEIDIVLVLTVHPGFYGSKFLPAALKKIKEIKRINPKIKVIIDGGMNPVTIKQAAKAGADYFISGSFVTKAEHPKNKLKSLLTALNRKS